LLEDIVTHLNHSLRTSGHAAISGHSSITIYLSLLACLDDLHSIARRAHQIAARYIDNNGHPEYSVGKPGVAMYPQDGTVAKELEMMARSRAAQAS
jgi:hypothetical protein